MDAASMLAFQRDMQDDLHGVTGTYARGATSTASVPATRYEMAIELSVDGDALSPQQVVRFDFIAADLLLDGSAATPRHGDTYTVSGTVYDMTGDFEVFLEGSTAEVIRAEAHRRT